MTIPKNLIFWTVTALATLFFAFLACIFFIEWWTVGVKKEISSYPWGQVNENPWFYDNPNLYANVILIETLLLAIPVGLTLWFMFKRNKVKTLYCLLGSLVALILIIVNGSVQS